jgi:hypothetical protein
VSALILEITFLNDEKFVCLPTILKVAFAAKCAVEIRMDN